VLSNTLQVDWGKKQKAWKKNEVGKDTNRQTGLNGGNLRDRGPHTNSITEKNTGGPSEKKKRGREKTARMVRNGTPVQKNLLLADKTRRDENEEGIIACGEEGTKRRKAATPQRHPSSCEGL